MTAGPPGDAVPRALDPDDLAWRCPPEWLPFTTTKDLAPHDEMVFQREAVGALRLGLRIRARGYNVYLAGMTGTGRTTMVRRLLEEERHAGPVPDDLLYVQNLRDPRAPRLLRLPAGKGRVLRDGMTSAAERFRQGLAALRASGAHRRRRERVARRYREQHARTVGAFQQEVEKDGFALVEANLGPIRRHDVAPLIDGQAVAPGELGGLVRDGKLPRETADDLLRRHSDLSARLAETTGQLRVIAEELAGALAEADRDAARPLVEETLEEVREQLGLPPGANLLLDAYLADVHDHLLDAFPALYAVGEATSESGEPEDLPDPLDALRVNVLVDRTGQTGRPVVEEARPTASRLLGHLEVQRTPDGVMHADIAGIRPGTLHHADGGFLLINAHDLIAEEGGWPALRRALRAGKIAVQVGGPGDAPAPIVPADAALDVTVVLVGGPALRDALAGSDEEFGKLFKVTAMLEERVPLSREAVASYTAYVARVAANEGLLPFEAAAVGRMVEQMVRVAGMRTRLSTRFRLLTDLAREAGWHAREAGATTVAREHVEVALAARRERQGLLSARIRESIADGTLLLQLEGRQKGQVNALAVVETSLERFGYPVRVTATAALGRSGIIDIEREAELSGEIHTKASLILAGYLRSRFAQTFPLAITASLCFEQSYGGVEGDSASAAELVALLSAIGDAPVRQDLAVTGAIDQRGNVLAVGGVNEKVEGFWRTCRLFAGDGPRGVVVPRSTVGTLQLDPELVEDVRAGRFVVYAVQRVEEIIEVMTGVSLGEPGADGTWPAGTLGARIARRLGEMADRLREFRDYGA